MLEGVGHALRERFPAQVVGDSKGERVDHKLRIIAKVMHKCQVSIQLRRQAGHVLKGPLALLMRVDQQCTLAPENYNRKIAHSHTVARLKHEVVDNATLENMLRLGIERVRHGGSFLSDTPPCCALKWDRVVLETMCRTLFGQHHALTVRVCGVILCCV